MKINTLLLKHMLENNCEDFHPKIIDAFYTGVKMRSYNNMLRTLLETTSEESHPVIINAFYVGLETNDEETIHELIEISRGVSPTADQCLDSLQQMFTISYW